MERLPYFKGEFYLILIGGVVFFSGLASEPIAALFGLALVVGTGFFAWQKWQRMDAEAQHRQTRANQAVARSTSGERDPRPVSAPPPRDKGGQQDLSREARRVAEALSAMGKQPYGAVAVDLNLDEAVVLGGLGELDEVGFVRRHPGGVYELAGLKRRRPSPPGVIAEESVETFRGEEQPLASTSCPSCEVPLIGDEDFCPDCGATIESPEDSDPDPTSDLPQVSTSSGAELATPQEPMDDAEQSVVDEQEAATSAGEEPAESHCIACDAALPDHAQFCRKCGVPVQGGVESEPVESVTDEGPTTCAGCMTVVPADAKFCRGCGRSIEDASIEDTPGEQLLDAAVDGSVRQPDHIDSNVGSETVGSIAVVVTAPDVCTACNARLPDGARFCRECGKAIE